MSMMTYLHELTCAVLLWGVFCRFTRSSVRVAALIRLVFWVLGIAACAGLIAPIVWAYQPHPVAVGMQAAFCLVQLVTAGYWVDGPPIHFLVESARPRRRHTDRS